MNPDKITLRSHRPPMVPSDDRPLATWRDWKRLAAISLGYLSAAIWPRRWDGWLIDRMASLFLLFAVEKVKQLANLMGQVLGPAATGCDLLQAARHHYYMRLEDAWGRIRDLHPQGWEPQVEAEGLEHVRQGLAAGRGVILWGMFFCGSTVTKAALWRAGIRLVHLSRADHGAPSLTRLGLGVAAALYCRAETRYLDRRIVIPLEGSPAYLRELMNLLDSNVCLSIAGEIAGKPSVCARLFGGAARFATGAPVLAWKKQSALLTCYVVREGRRRYRVVIEAPIATDRTLPRDEFVEAAVEQFARRLEDHIARHPADWQGWHMADRISDLTDPFPAGAARRESLSL
ncbi:MAG: hypothetical protein HY236_08575 [Acidobacteria bacterium]|nr:hypothetical protein [Acidobacteriota bacterium]